MRSDLDVFCEYDLDGDSLEMEPTQNPRAKADYDAFLSVVCRSGAMYISRPQAERLRDYLDVVLAR